MRRFYVLCTDSGSGFLTVILDTDCMYLVHVAIWILLIHVILNAILYPELSFSLRYTISLSTLILQDFCKI